MCWDFIDREISFRDIFEPFCETFLTERGLSPFSTLRHWVHQLARIVKNTQRPYTVEVISGSSVRMNDRTFSLKDIAAGAQQEICELEEFIMKEVLLGVSLDKLGIQCHLSDLKDTTDRKTQGYSPFYGTSTFRKVLAAFVQEGHLGLMVEHDKLIMDPIQSVRWVSTVGKVWNRLSPLIHVASGPTSRGVESSLHQIGNTINSPRHLMVQRDISLLPGEDSGNTEILELTSNYHKGSAIEGYHKYSTKVIPYPIARLLMIMIEIVRPIEEMMALRFIVPEEKKQVARDNYRTYLYVTYGNRWNADRLTKNLQQFLKKAINVPMGLRMYRHVSILFNRMHGVGDGDGKDELEKTAEELTGHIRATGDMNYAVVKGASSTPYSERLKSIKVCRGSHLQFGFGTNEEEDKPLAVDRRSRYIPPAMSTNRLPIVVDIKHSSKVSSTKNRRKEEAVKRSKHRETKEEEYKEIAKRRPGKENKLNVELPARITRSKIRASLE